MKSNIRKKFKYNKISLILFILILYFSFLFQGNNISLNEQDDKDSKNFVFYSSVSNSVFVEWNITFGGSMDEVGMGVALDSSGNVYVTGFTNLGGGFSGMFLVKYDNSGVQQWISTWGGWDGEGNAITVDSADNVYVTGKMENDTGMTNDDMFLMKYDSSGIQQWNRSWGGTFNDEGFGVVVDSTGNVYVTGDLDSEETSEHDIFLVKYDNSGELQWDHTLAVSLDDDVGYGLAVDSSDNVYLTGKVNELMNFLGDMILIKYNSSGEQQWNRTWGGTYLDQGMGVVVDSSDNIYITGFTENFGAGGTDIILVKYDTSGEQLWNRTWGGSMDDAGMGVAVDSYDNVYITGGTESFGVGSSDICLVKYDSSGEQLWNHIWGGSMLDAGMGVAVDSSDNIYITGATESFGVEGSDMCVVKFASKKPEIIINSPNQNEFFGSMGPNFDISIIESDFNTTWYNLNNGINFTFSELTGTINQTLWDNVNEGVVNIKFYANNTRGNEGFSEVSVFKDITAPSSILSFTPHKGENIVLESTMFNLSANDGAGSGVSEIHYRINNSAWFEYGTLFTLTEYTPGFYLIYYYSIDEVDNIEDFNSILVELISPKSPAIPGYNLYILIGILSVVVIFISKKLKKS